MGGGGEVMWTKSKRTAVIPHETVPNSRTKSDLKTQVYKGSPPPKCFVKREGGPFAIATFGQPFTKTLLWLVPLSLKRNLLFIKILLDSYISVHEVNLQDPQIVLKSGMCQNH